MEFSSNQTREKVDHKEIWSTAIVVLGPPFFLTITSYFCLFLTFIVLFAYLFEAENFQKTIFVSSSSHIKRGSSFYKYLLLYAYRFICTHLFFLSVAQFQHSVKSHAETNYTSNSTVVHFVCPSWYHYIHMEHLNLFLFIRRITYGVIR